MDYREDWNGMNWIRKEKRLAIYLRDKMTCCYCGKHVSKVTLTLDHVKPVSRGGQNDATNLVTACKPCNDSKEERTVKQFARERFAIIEKSRVRPINVPAAKQILSRCGSWTGALAVAARS